MTASGDTSNGSGASPSEGHTNSDKAADPVPQIPVVERSGGDHHGNDDDEVDGELEGEVEEIAIRPEALKQQFASPADVEAGLQLIDLCREGDLSAVVQRVRVGAPAGFITKSGWTPVAAAAYGGFNDVLVYLLGIGADGMYESSAPWRKHQLSGSTSASVPKDPLCNTPLHWACYQGHLDTVSILLAVGYNPEATDTVGNQCLHLACSGGHREVVEQLLAHSAAVDPRNKYGNRALDMATDPSCRRLLARYQSQTSCEWCKEPFSRLRRPSLCQHCHNVFCDTKPCSSSSTAPLSTGVDMSHDSPAITEMLAQARSTRYCQECATEMGKAEQGLRNVLGNKLELIRRTLAVLDPSININVSRPATTTASVPNEANDNLGEVEGDAEPPNVSLVHGDEAASTEAGEVVIPLDGTTIESNGVNSESSTSIVQTGLDTPATPSEVSRPAPNTDEDFGGGDTGRMESSRSARSSKRRALPSVEIIMNALTLSQTDAEALYTALEAAQLKCTDAELLRTSKQTYRQLAAHVTLQEELKSLLAMRPIGIRSLLEPLKRALQHAKREQVHPVMLGLAVQLIQSAEAECTLFGCHALCEKIDRGSRRYSKDIARLEASLAEAQLRGVSEKLLATASALRDRLNAEVRLEACLVPFTAPPPVDNPTGAILPAPAPGSGGYAFNDGTTRDTLLQALEYRTQLVTAAVDNGTAIEGVAPALLEEANTLLKQLKKEVRDETKAEEERRKALEEAALKAAKKGKKKKA